MSRLVLPLIVLLLPIVLLGVRQFYRKPVEVAPEYAAAVESAKLLREWCTWLATLSTAAVGVAALGQSGIAAKSAGSHLAVLTVFAFTLSLICTATLLLALPSLVARLKTSAVNENDLAEQAAFMWATDRRRHLLRVGYLASAQYYFFIVAIGLVTYLFATQALGPN